MALPVVNKVSSYETVLPLTGKKIKYRPFLTGEEKVLLMAIESNKPDDIRNAIFQIINQCIQTENVEIEKLPTVDVEHIFFCLRRVSVGEVIELTMKPPVRCESENCPTQVEVGLHLDDIKLVRDPRHNKKIMLNENIGVVMTYPIMSMTFDSTSKVQAAFDLIVDSIEKVFDENDVYDMSKVKHDEKVEWLNSLTKDQLAKIFEFFDTIPYHEVNLKSKCKGCGKDFEWNVKGMADFFT